MEWPNFEAMRYTSPQLDRYVTFTTNYMGKLWVYKIVYVNERDAQKQASVLRKKLHNGDELPEELMAELFSNWIKEENIGWIEQGRTKSWKFAKGTRPADEPVILEKITDIWAKSECGVKRHNAGYQFDNYIANVVTKPTDREYAPHNEPTVIPEGMFIPDAGDYTPQEPTDADKAIAEELNRLLDVPTESIEEQIAALTGNRSGLAEAMANYQATNNEVMKKWDKDYPRDLADEL